MRLMPALLVAVTPVTLRPLAAQTASTPRAERVAADVRLLAADALGGRAVCTSGGDSAAIWIAAQLRRLGLRPGGDSGTYFQRWTIGNTENTRRLGIAGCATMNVVGVLPGRGRLAGQSVLVGAHFDHLGTGGGGASRATGDDTLQIHNGADDNASGTAAVLEIARTLLADRRAPGHDQRAILFLFWNAEERGALGSAYYANNPTVPLDSAIAYLNFDMVGRLRNARLAALGARTAVEWPSLLDSVNATWRLDLRASGDGWGPSDHASFTAKRRPVLHFFTDLHDDYHHPRDDAERIDADGIVRVADLGADLARRLAQRPWPLMWVDVPQPRTVAATPGRSRPSLGTIPDMTDEPGGVRLSGVRPGSPADSAGLRQGDVLIGLGPHTIASLQDFQNALMQMHGGDRVELRYRRGDTVHAVMVTLGGGPPRD
jgi:hypothetical protein